MIPKFSKSEGSSLPGGLCARKNGAVQATLGKPSRWGAEGLGKEVVSRSGLEVKT